MGDKSPKNTAKARKQKADKKNAQDETAVQKELVNPDRLFGRER